MFKVGDIIKGKPEADDEYSITDSNMTKALVKKIRDNGTMLIEVLEHSELKSKVGEEYEVENSDKYFELIKSSKTNPFSKYITLPKRYTGNENATILFWNDDTKTVVKKNQEDAYDIAKGFLWAYFLKTSGMSRTQANKYIEKVVNDIIAANGKEKDKKKKKKVK